MTVCDFLCVWYTIIQLYMVQYSIVVALRIIRGLPGIILWPASHWAPLALKRLARYFLATSYFNKRQIFLASYFFTKRQLYFQSLWIESAPKMQRWSLKKKIKHTVSNWACFHALDNCKNLFYANIVELLALFLKFCISFCQFDCGGALYLYTVGNCHLCFWQRPIIAKTVVLVASSQVGFCL